MVQITVICSCVSNKNLFKFSISYNLFKCVCDYVCVCVCVYACICMCVDVWVWPCLLLY